MSSEIKNCPVCEKPNGFKVLSSDRSDDAYFVSCSRCGKYKVHRECYIAPAILNGPRHILSGFLRLQNLEGNEEYYVRGRSVYDEIKSRVLDDYPSKLRAILRFLYIQSDGTTKAVKLHPSTEYTVGFCYDSGEFVRLVNDLKDQNLIEIVQTGTEEEGWKIRLHPKGVDVVNNRRQLEEDNMSKQSSTVNMNFNAPVGVVQNGDGAIAHVNQNLGLDTKELIQLLAEARRLVPSVLPAERGKEAIELIEATERELNSTTPSPPKLVERVSTLGNFFQGVDAFGNICARLLNWIPLLSSLTS